jgi:hypothetical protein
MAPAVIEPNLTVSHHRHVYRLTHDRKGVLVRASVGAMLTLRREAMRRDRANRLLLAADRFCHRNALTVRWALGPLRVALAGPGGLSRAARLLGGCTRARTVRPS